jgi:hypothetical protein
MAATCLASAALAQVAASSKRDTPRGVAGAKGASGAPGAVVQYEEAASTGIVYLQESGGMMSSVSGPVRAAGEEMGPAPAVVPAPVTAPRATPPAAAPGKLAQRRAPADAVKP